MSRHSFLPLICGLAAGIAGLLLAGPHDLLVQRLGAGFAPTADLAQALSGALAFAADDWRFPLLDVEGLTATKASIIFTDSIPLYAILWKLAGCGPDILFRYYIPVFIVLNFLLQGVCAAFVLRWLSVRHAMALFAGALLFVFWPSFLFRFTMEHLALTSHWTVILAVGLLLFPRSWGSRANACLAGWCALTGIALLIHVYLAAMVGSCFLARLVIEFRHDGLTMSAGSAVGTALARLMAYLALCLGVGFVFGYLQGSNAGIGGYGFYSMNLAAPWIALDTSLFMPNWSDFPAGQIEGYTYIPLSVMALLGLVANRVLHVRSIAIPGCKENWRAAAVLAIALTAFSVSNSLYLGGTRIATIPLPDMAMQLADVFRSSGRFFWPVSYMMLCMVVAGACRWLPGVKGAIVLLCVALLAIVEMTPLRSKMEPRLGPYASDPAIQALFSAVGKVSVFPPYGCGQHAVDSAHHEIQLLAAKAGALVRNSLVSARPANNCSLAGLSRMRPAPPSGELDIILGVRFAATALAGAGVPLENCRKRNNLVFCLANWNTAANYVEYFKPLTPDFLNFPVKLEFRRGSNGTPYLLNGFSTSEGWGVWSIGDKSQLVLPLDPNSRSPRRLMISVSGFIPPNQSNQDIRVTLDSRQENASWLVEEQFDLHLMPGETRKLVFERDDRPISALRLTFSNSRPVSPYDLGLGIDRRKLGIALYSIQVE